MKARRRLPILLIFILAAAVSLPLAASERPQPKPVVDFIAESDALVFKPLQEVERLHLRITNPDGLTIDRIFKSGGGMFTMGELIEEVRELSLEGCYTWEVRGVPILTQEEEEILNNGRDLGRPAPIWLQVKLESLLQSGTFSVSRGAFVYDDLQETDVDDRLQATSSDLARQGESGTELGPVLGPVSAVRSEELPLDPQFDFLINDDLIVVGSACIGFDCVNGEVFSFDTIRMKENNLRIKFDDTSSASGFPNTDWQLTANDSASGGIGKFSIEDISGSRIPFTIEAGAPSNSLYVDSSGRIGRRTSNPVLELHVVDGDSPALRLEQDGSSGFQPQTWDIAGNETNFFVRDVTSGSRLPFRIRPGASSNSLFIDSDSDVGVGTSSPSSSLHVRRTDGTARVLVEEASTTVDNSRVLLQLTNNGSVRYDMTDTNTNVNWSTRNLAAGYTIQRTGDADTEFQLADDGTLTISGSLIQNSDRNSKRAVLPVDSNEILAKLAGLPISTWNYKADEPWVRHLGPMAQDFAAAFGLGPHDRGISPGDMAGVTMAAVQALHRQNEELRAENEDLAARLEKLEALVSSLTDRPASTAD